MKGWIFRQVREETWDDITSCKANWWCHLKDPVAVHMAGKLNINLYISRVALIRKSLIWNFWCLVSILRCLAIFCVHNFKSTYHSALSSLLTTFTSGTWRGYLSTSVSPSIFFPIFCKMDPTHILVYCTLKFLPIITSNYMGLIVCNINVSFQLTWQQHKGVMWLCQLQSLQVTQPLGG